MNVQEMIGEFHRVCENRKIVSDNDITVAMQEAWRRLQLCNLKVVLTSGSFDVYHGGHLRYPPITCLISAFVSRNEPKKPGHREAADDGGRPTVRDEDEHG